MTRSDRKDLAVLGLVLLGWGLLVAPLLHASTHAHGHAHSHGLPQGPHGAGTLEHLSLACLETPALPELVPQLTIVALREPIAPAAPAVFVPRRAEQPQGP
ncbi:MAG: hypothetical protein U0228_33840 [Myxococcaceae bacterium]